MRIKKGFIFTFFEICNYGRKNGGNALKKQTDKGQLIFPQIFY